MVRIMRSVQIDDIFSQLTSIRSMGGGFIITWVQKEVRFQIDISVATDTLKTHDLEKTTLESALFLIEDATSVSNAITILL